MHMIFKVSDAVGFDSALKASAGLGDSEESVASVSVLQTYIRTSVRAFAYVSILCVCVCGYLGVLRLPSVRYGLIFRGPAPRLSRPQIDRGSDRTHFRELRAFDCWKKRGVLQTA